jgi:ubiquinone/menaquinone biosynthesis C-methylase UbiE
MGTWDLEWERFNYRLLKRHMLKLTYNMRKHQLYSHIKKLSSTAARSIKLLDVGCGAGLRTLILAKTFPIKLYLIDNSHEALKLAEANAKLIGVDNVDVKYGNVLRIPYPDEFFDVVYSGGVLEHLSGNNRYVSFKEMLRVTRKGGTIFVHVPNSASPLATLGKTLTKLLKLWSFGLEIPYSRMEAESIIKRLDNIRSARIEVAGDSNFLLSLMWFPPLVLFNFTALEIPMRKLLGAVNIPIMDECCGEWLSIVISK